MIKIELTDPTEQDARAVVAAMVALHGDGVVPSLEMAGKTYEEYSGRTEPTATNIAAGISALHKALPDAPAPDGYPVDPSLPASEGGMDGHGAPDDIPAPERDSDGIPWDERIHASTKSANKDGTWTRRRNTPDAAFDAVMAELRAANTARTMEAAALLTQPKPTAADAFAPTPPPVPTPPAASAPTPPPAPAPAPVTGSAPSFVQLMQKITAAQQAGKLDKAELDEALGQCGIEGVAKLVTADDGTRAAFDAVLTAAIA